MQHHLRSPIDNDLIADAIEASFGARPGHVGHIQTESSRSVYEATLTNNREVILKAEDGAAPEDFRLALEAWAIEQARSVGVPAPAILAEDFALSHFSFRYVVMERARGVALHDAGLPPELQRQALRHSGSLLARMHRIPVTGYGTLNEQYFLASDEVMGRFARWAVLSSLRAEAALNALYGEGMFDVEEAAGAMHMIEKESALDEPAARLLHGDFSARHTFVDPTTAAVTAILDFGDRMAGAPTWDLAGAWLWNAYLPGLVEDATDYVIEGYEAERGTPIPRDRFTVSCLMRLLIVARAYYEQGRLAEYGDIRTRLRALLEEAGRL